MSNNLNYFNPEQELLSRSELTDLQDQRLKKIVSHVAQNNSWFRQRFNEAGVVSEAFGGLADLERLPMMSKLEFRENYPDLMGCVPREKIAEMHMSSGSTGTPVVMLYTENDLAQWAECMARCYCMAGSHPGDVVQITPGMGLFNGGFGCYHGARAAGLFILPCGPGNTVRQIKLARDFKSRILTGVVSYGVRIMEVLEEQKGKLPDLEIGIFGAETFSQSMKEHLQQGLGIEVFDIYGMTETGGIGTLGMDCQAHNGTHLWEDHYIAEIIDPATGKAVADGEVGELVVTSLTREALPVIRFRTGDLTKIISRDICSCGRTHMRLAPVSGRVDDMLIIKGVNIFPSQVEQALLQIPGILPNYQLLVREVHGMQTLTVQVEAESGVTGYMVEKHLKEVLGFSPAGDVFPAGTLPRAEGKAKRVVYIKDDEVK